MATHSWTLPQKIEVPDLDCIHLTKLISLVNPSHEPTYVDIRPEDSTKVSDCFNIVRKKVETHGGQMIFGWQVWLTTNLIEAEAHAIWETPDQELIDITPKGFIIPQILFLEDENRSYQGKQIDSFRLNISTNRLVDDLIIVCKEIFAFDNRGERAFHYDLSHLLSDKQINHRRYMLKLKSLITQLLENSGTTNSKCLCNSSFRYKDCHGKYLKQKLLSVK